MIVQEVLTVVDTKRKTSVGSFSKTISVPIAGLKILSICEQWLLFRNERRDSSILIILIKRPEIDVSFDALTHIFKK
jgi:hypothetical protein